MTAEDFIHNPALSEEDVNRITRQILDYCGKQECFSYYDLKKYMFDNDLFEWIVVLRKPGIRRMVSVYLRDKHKLERPLKYKTEYPDAVVAALDSEIAFRKRHGLDEM